MNLNMDNQLNITGPNTTAVVEALNGGQHTTGDKVYFDPERIIPMPEGLDEVTLDEMGRSERDRDDSEQKRQATAGSKITPALRERRSLLF